LKLKLKTKKKKEKEKVIKFWGVQAGLLLLLCGTCVGSTQQFLVHITIPSQQEPIKTEVFFKSFAFLCFSES